MVIMGEGYCKPAYDPANTTGILTASIEIKLSALYL